MWTETTREDYRRDDLSYASRTRDEEWAELAWLLPSPRRLGRPRKWALREIVDALLYIGWSGCQWRALPTDFPPYSTVQRYFYRWRDDGTWVRINAALVARELLGRKAVPRRGLSTARACRRPKAAARAALTQASASTGASGILSPIPMACCSRCGFTKPTSKTRTARCRCCMTCDAAFPSGNTSSPTVSTAGRSCKRRLPIAAPGPSRSSSGRPASKASNCCRGAGWSSGVLPGSAVAAAWQKTSRQPSPVPPHGSSLPICDYLSAAWLDLNRSHQKN